MPRFKLLKINLQMQKINSKDNLKNRDRYFSINLVIGRCEIYSLVES